MTEQVATPAATPAPATPTTPAPEADSVTLPKAEVDNLRREAARAAEAQARADRLEKANKRTKTHFDPASKPAPPSQEDVEAQGRAEDAKAERGLMRLASNPEFREVLDADPTLRDLLLNNPLAVLPMYAADALDAEDALDMVKETLAARASARKAAAAPAPDPKKPDPSTPPAGGVNVPTTAMSESEAYESAKKNPHTENALAGMIAAKIKSGAVQKQ